VYSERNCKKRVFLPFFYVTTYNNFIFLAHSNIKKPPPKVAHNRTPIFFSCTGPAAQTCQELIFHVTNMSQDAYVLLSVTISSEDSNKPQILSEISVQYSSHSIWSSLCFPEIQKSLPKSSLSILRAASKSLAALCKLDLGTNCID
jgi:hypothetical protein